MIKHQGNISKGLETIKKIPNVVAVAFDDAKNSSGLLEKATFTIKNNYATANAETNGSSKILEGFKPSYDSTVFQLLNKAGAACLAKVHMDELALGGTGTYSAYGPIKNPLNPERLIGGSSSGSAASLVEGVTFSIGSDTGDSVRNPASYIGKVGFKPSYGAISRHGLYAFATSLDTVGYLTHNVSDTISVSDVLFGKDEKDMTSREVGKPVHEEVKPKKIAILKNFIDFLDDDYKKSFNAFVEKLKADGIKIVEENISMDILEAIDPTYSIISFSEASSNLANLNGIAFGQRQAGSDWKEIITNTRSKKFGSMLQRRITLGGFFLAIENQQELFEKAQKVRRVIVNEFKRIYEKADFILSVATPIAPKTELGKSHHVLNDYLIHSNFEGSPSIVLPFGKSKDMPFGISLDAWQDQDKQLLSNALYIEKMIGGNNE